ncbi:MAG TPA: DUF5682 family protein [Polyangiales bacterium]|nr:DUF5682 family protein [Polyangiales bacterium]
MSAVAPTLLTAAELRAFSDTLFSPELIYFPVRHHSPACAYHVRKLIVERRPTQVLIEGPNSFDELVPLLCEQDAKPPLAIYSYCGSRAAGKPRRGAYYPLCDYSPEWVALREGRAIGAEIKFIDLDLPQQLAVDRGERLSGRLATLLDERHFARSAYLRKLAAERGCRDHDELWDRLFEAWAARIPSEEFVAQVAAYCRLARLDVSDAEHEHDGTLAREAEMAWHIARAKQAGSGPILVVTGGYHTLVLPQLVAARPKRPKLDVRAFVDPGRVMIRYSFDRLDRLNGYAAGMPHPAFYQGIWQAAGQPEQLDALALELATETAQRVRERQLEPAPSTAAVIAAYEQAIRLARLRGNPQPMRYDVLDALASCYVKGAIDGEGRALLAVADQILRGSAVGEVPRAAGLPGTVLDFRQKARAFRLKIDDSDTRKLTLEVYREPAHRNTSRFLHVLDFLEVPFARLLSGPQLTAAYVGKRLQEIWEYAWSPQTDSALIDAAIHGNTLLEAAADRFLEELRSLEDSGEARSAAAATERLARACLLGLHDSLPLVMDWLRRCVREDPEPASLATALGQLTLLWESREPLGAAGLEAVPELAKACLERACYLLPELARTPDERSEPAIAALLELRHAVSATRHAWFDAELYWSALTPLATLQPCAAAIAGAAGGALYASGRWSEAELARALRGRLTGRATAAYFRGLAAAAREALWQSEGVLQALRELIEQVDDAQFLELLPELRLAFSTLTPRETDRLGDVIARALGVTALGPLVTHAPKRVPPGHAAEEVPLGYGIEAAEVQNNLRVARQLEEVMRRDGLGGWLP